MPDDSRASFVALARRVRPASRGFDLFPDTRPPSGFPTVLCVDLGLRSLLSVGMDTQWGGDNVWYTLELREQAASPSAS